MIKEEEETTGLLWPRTWNGAYILVVSNFAFWIIFLILIGKVWQ